MNFLAFLQTSNQSIFTVSSYKPLRPSPNIWITSQIKLHKCDIYLLIICVVTAISHSEVRVEGAECTFRSFFCGKLKTWKPCSSFLYTTLPIGFLSFSIKCEGKFLLLWEHFQYKPAHEGFHLISWTMDLQCNSSVRVKTIKNQILES